MVKIIIIIIIKVTLWFSFQKTKSCKEIIPDKQNIRLSAGLVRRKKKKKRFGYLRMGQDLRSHADKNNRHLVKGSQRGFDCPIAKWEHSSSPQTAYSSLEGAPPSPRPSARGPSCTKG